MSQIRSFEGSFDPFATYANLRGSGILGEYSYFEVTPGGAEIGWNPVEHLRLMDGENVPDWKARLQALAHRAGGVGRKAVGYIGFDSIYRSSGTLPDGSVCGLPLIEFMIPSETLVFQCNQVVHLSSTGLDVRPHFAGQSPKQVPMPLKSNLVPSSGTEAEEFLAGVRSAVSAISSRSIQKIVLSRYESYTQKIDPLLLLAALRPKNLPSYLLSYGPLTAVVPSPEVLLEAKGGSLHVNPLAGTRPRGDTESGDQRLRTELRANHKEIAEHILSVTAMWDEIGAHCKPESLAVRNLMSVAMQPKVQHLSSDIYGELSPDSDVLEVLWSLFPAITVTGIPKIAALGMIRKLESHPRFLYSGAVGWMSGRENCHFALAIRSVFQHSGRTYLQAGAGIMLESVAEKELSETTSKLSAMREALAASVVGADGCSAAAGPVGNHK